MNGGKSALQYVPQKVSFVKLYGSLTSQTAYCRGDKIGYTCHQFEKKDSPFSREQCVLYFEKKKKKELLEKQ